MLLRPTAERDGLLDVLLTNQNDDGGWGYYAGHRSRMEPTCWASIALCERLAADQQMRSRVTTLLDRWQGTNGLLAEPSVPPNLSFNGLALIVLGLLAAPGERDHLIAAAKRLSDGLCAIRGIKAGNQLNSRQNNQLQAWPWIDGTFSWVEPTSWCVLALKQWRRRAPATEIERRLADAEALLVDRECSGGGWNYGNPNVLGQNLLPYVPTTAAALLALQDRSDRPFVQRGLRYLASAWRSEPSGYALSVATIALAVHGIDTRELVDALAKTRQRTGFLGNLGTVAMAACAAGIDNDHVLGAFRV